MSDIVPRRPPVPETAPLPPQLPLLRSDPAEPAPGEGIPLREYLGALRRHLWLILTAVVVSVGFAAYRIRQEPPRYTAASAVRLVNARQEMAGQIGTGQQDQLPGWYTDPILSQIQVLRSRAVAQEVVDSVGGRLKPEDPEFPFGLLRDVVVTSAARPGDTLSLTFTRAVVRGRMGARTAQAEYGQPLDLGGVRLTVQARPPRYATTRLNVVDARSAEMWAIGSMTPVQREMTNVIDIQFTANDPVVAQRAANAAAASFQTVSMRSAQTQSRRRRVFVEEQLRSTDSLLLVAQQQLSAFRRGVRAFSPREKFRTTEEGLAEFRLRRQALLTEKGIYDQMGRELRTDRGREGSEQIAALAASPEVATNGGIVALYQQLIKYQTSRDSLTTGRWSRAGTNPDVQQLDSLISTYRGRLVRAVQARSDALAAQIGVLDEVMSADAASIAGLPDAEAEEMRLSREVETLQKLVDDLRRDHQEARIDEAVEAGQVEIVDWALAPGTPVGTGGRRRLLFALLVGLMIGGGGALVLDRLNTALVRREDAEAALHVPVIAVIPRIGDPLRPADRLQRLRTRLLPRLPQRAEERGNALVTVNDLHSVGSQAYRKLRTHLIFSQGGQPPRTLMITSPAASEGKTTVSANLATTFAQQGLRVALLDADLRRPRMHGVFALSRTPGLTEVLQGEAPLDEALRTTGVDGLHVMGAGRLVGAVSELLGGADMGRLLRELHARYDVVVLDTPPVLAAADAEILAAQADAVLVVVRAGQTERQSAHYAIQQLRAIGARIVGAVLNDPDQKTAGYGKYSYYYDYYAEAAD
ncbi:polysaccharide biosynthesis tyrosine autokinase [Longimicrobium sp.]|uniref:polysaccharide biosynthesis tyrosine autokinase n=1 Tax=Longimicrobium sp. TaxID=2029185 RepID=UPI002E32D943|nr:polysaccharide biosynthesis tyrosine autokinase [Longimicrobium sp.]HEX6036609.1 polysaccharide biosynthesis tyrosine autokinase [Longimicrobium sp.]